MRQRRKQIKPLLLDGGFGRELHYRGVEIPKTIWAAGALISDPDIVEQIHVDYILAGADIITINSYGIIRDDLAKEGIVERFEELNILACQLAINARNRTRKDVLIAGSLPPLHGSFRPDLVGPLDEIFPLYQEQAGLLAPYVDLFICETMSSAAESYAAAKAALQYDKPVWISWTLDEDHSGNLRSGESVNEAVRALDGLPVEGILANCSAPESISNFIGEAVNLDVDRVGGYGNTFSPIPKTWTLGGEQETDGLLSLRDDLGPRRYGEFAKQWLHNGANVIGGCCGTRPAHITVLRELISAHSKTALFP